MRKRALSLLLCLCLAFSLLPGAALAAGGQYDDIAGHWAEDAITRWSEYKIVGGSGGHFRPDAPLTRGEMARILSSLLGLTEQAAKNPFADVDTKAWYAPFVLRCYAAGIMMGDGVNAHPADTITRQEAIAMLCRALAIAEKKNPDLSGFADGDKVADWAKGAVAAMTKAKIVNGVSGNLLAPEDEINRASVITILDRAIVQYINTPGKYTLADKDGIVLVAAAGDVTLTGETSADILVAPASQGKTLTFEKAVVTGNVTVQADDMTVTGISSVLPEITTVGDNISVETGKPAAPVGGGSYIPPEPSASLSADKTADGYVSVGAVVTARIENPDSADVVWLIGGVETAVSGNSYTVTASDLGKEIQVKLVKGETDEAVSNTLTVEKSAATTLDELKTQSESAPVTLAEETTFMDDNKQTVTVDSSSELVLTVEPKAVSTEEAETKITNNTAANNILVSAVEKAMSEAVEGSVPLTAEQKNDLVAATKVVAVDVDLTLVEKTEAGQTTETPVHPVGETTVTLSAAQLGLAGEDLNLYHFNATHTNIKGEVQNIAGTVNPNEQGVGVSVTFKTNGLSTIWIGNVPPRTVTFNTDGGSAVAPQRVRFGSTVDTGKVGAPTKAGSIFCGWNYDLAKTPIISDLEVMAKWVEGTTVPADRYTVTLSPADAKLTADKTDGKYTVKAAPDGEYAANITAAVSVTPYTGAVKYVLSAAAETAANTTDPSKFSAVGSAESIALTPNAAVTNDAGAVVAGKTSYYIKWMAEKGDVLALEELLVIVDDGKGAAATKVITRDINRGVGTFEPYLESTAKADAPKWVGYINGNPQRVYSNNSDEWNYRLYTRVGFNEHFSGDYEKYSYKDYDVLHLEFTPFTGESYAGKSISAEAACYDSSTHQSKTVNASAQVDSATGKLDVSIPLGDLNEPATSSWIGFDMLVTVGDVTQEIYVNTRNPLYTGSSATQVKDGEAADLTELRALLSDAAKDPGSNWFIIYSGTDPVTLTDSLTVPDNVDIHCNTSADFTVGNGGELTLQSGEDKGASVSFSFFSVASGGKLIAEDTRTGEQDHIYPIGIDAQQINVAGGGTVEVMPNTSLSLSPGPSPEGQCTLEKGSQVILSSTADSIAQLDMYSFTTVSLNGSILANDGGSLYVRSDSVNVGGTIEMRRPQSSRYWSGVQFNGDVTVGEEGSINLSGDSSMDMMCPLTNLGEISLEDGAYGSFTNTGFAQYNRGTITVGSDCWFNLQGTKLVNTGTITGSGNVNAVLGDDTTDYDANHTGLEFERIGNSDQPSPDNYSRYKFTAEPAPTIDVTLYKGEISNEQGGTVDSGLNVMSEDFPAE